MERTCGGSGDEGQVDVGLGHTGQLDLGLLGGVLQSLHDHLVAAEVNAVLSLELVGHPVDDALVEVVAAQAVVACGSQNLEHTVGDLQQGDVECTAAQVEDQDALVVLLVHTVSQGGGGRLVDDALYVQTGDLTRVLGSLALGVGEVSGNRDDRVGDGGAQVSLRVSLHLLKDHSGDLLRGVVLAVHSSLVSRTHMALDGADGAVGIGDRLALRHLADHALARLGEGHYGGGGSRAFGIGDNDGLGALKNSHARIGGTKVNTDDLCHNSKSPFYSCRCSKLKLSEIPRNFRISFSADTGRNPV